MSGLPSLLLKKLKDSLLECGPFGSDRALLSVFSDDRIAPWKNLVSEATSRKERVDYFVSDFLDRKNSAGQSVLVLFLLAVFDRGEEEDVCSRRLSDLAIEVAVALDVRMPPLARNNLGRADAARSGERIPGQVAGYEFAPVELGEGSMLERLPPGLPAHVFAEHLESLKNKERADWLPISFLEQGLRAAQGVGRVEFQQRLIGTAFLVAPDLVLTNTHVVRTLPILAASGVRFNVGLQAEAQWSYFAEQVAGSAVEDLDFALLRINPPSTAPPVKLSLEAAFREQPANILQFPASAGGLMQVALRRNAIVRVEPTRLYYVTDTEGGSSGSPVFSDDWRVIALHRAGMADDTWAPVKNANQGVPLTAIEPHIGAYVTAQPESPARDKTVDISHHRSGELEVARRKAPKSPETDARLDVEHVASRELRSTTPSDSILSAQHEPDATAYRRSGLYHRDMLRPDAFDRAIEGLADPKIGIVLITGEPGMGKTCLALHLEHLCKDPSLFDQVVWVPDPDKETKETTLRSALHTIATAVGPRSLAEHDVDVQKSEVRKALRRQRVLLVFEDFNATADVELTQWLLDLRHRQTRSKVLMTCSDTAGLPALFEVTLEGLDDEEGEKFIRERVRMFMSDAQLFKDDLQEWACLCGGNPELMKLSVGLLKHKSVAEVLELLESPNTNKSFNNETFNKVFASHWQILSRPENKNAADVLLALAVLPNVLKGLKPDWLAEAVGLKPEDCNDAVKRLDELAFLIHLRDREYRCCLTPSIRKFAALRLAELKGQDPQRQAFETDVQEGWIGCVERFVAPFQWPLRKLSVLNALEPEAGIVHATIDLAFRTQRWESTIRIADGIDHFYYIRGRWKEEKKEIDEWRVQAAQKLSNASEEARAIAQQVQLWARRTDIAGEQIVNRLARLSELETSPVLPSNVFVQVQHAFAFYEMALADNTDVEGPAHREAARQILQRCRDREESLPRLDPYFKIANRHWLATCLYKEDLLLEARKCFMEGRDLAYQHNYERSGLYCRMYLEKISIERDEVTLEEGKDRLGAILNEVVACHEARYEAYIHQSYAHLYLRYGDVNAAEAEVAKASELYEKIGLRDDRRELERIKRRVEESKLRNE